MSRTRTQEPNPNLCRASDEALRAGDLAYWGGIRDSCEKHLRDLEKHPTKKAALCVKASDARPQSYNEFPRVIRLATTRGNDAGGALTPFPAARAAIRGCPMPEDFELVQNVMLIDRDAAYDTTTHTGACQAHRPANVDAGKDREVGG